MIPVKFHHGMVISVDGKDVKRPPASKIVGRLPHGQAILAFEKGDKLVLWLGSRAAPSTVRTYHWKYEPFQMVTVQAPVDVEEEAMRTDR